MEPVTPNKVEKFKTLPSGQVVSEGWQATPPTDPFSMSIPKGFTCDSLSCTKVGKKVTLPEHLEKQVSRLAKASKRARTKICKKRDKPKKLNHSQPTCPARR